MRKLFAIGLGSLTLLGCESQIDLSARPGKTVERVTTSPATSDQILIGQEAWDSSGSKLTGSMPSLGNWNVNTTAWPGAGYYSALTSTLTPTNVCQGTQIFGATGAAVCQIGTTGAPAGAANILLGLEAWSAAGIKVTGSMINRGTLDASASFAGAGFYSGAVTNVPTANQIVAGNTVLGVAGSAGSTFGAFTSSNASRDIGTSQITAQAEVTAYSGAGGSPALPSTGGFSYRGVPKILKDDEGQYNSDNGCVSNCTPIVAVSAARHGAFGDCGTSQTTTASRIADCNSVNGTLATWNGQTNGTHGEAIWKLVTRLGANKEVWQDQRTGLVWSSVVAPLSIGDNWCRAAGNAEASDPNNYCNSVANQPQYPIAESGCAEDPGLVEIPGWCSNGSAYPSAAGCTGAGGTWTANSENYASGIYSAAKGGMGANSATLKIRWRLPTRWDFEQADLDGIHYVMPDMGAFGASVDWTATVMSTNRGGAWVVWQGFAAIQGGTRNSSGGIRCVGR